MESHESREAVGTYHEREAREGVRVSFEYAGAGEIHNTRAGDYPLRATAGDRWFIARVDSTRVDSWFQNRIGAQYGSDNRDTTPTPAHVSEQLDAYSVAQMVKAGRVTLAAGWELSPEDPAHKYADGEYVQRIQRTAKV